MLFGEAEMKHAIEIKDWCELMVFGEAEMSTQMKSVIDRN